MRSQLENNDLFDPVLKKGLKLGSLEYIPATGWALPADSPPLVILNPAGAVNVLLPTSTPARKGLMFMISNPSAFTVTLQTDGGAGFTTAIVLATLETAWVYCTGSATQAVGWRGTATAPST